MAINVAKEQIDSEVYKIEIENALKMALAINLNGNTPSLQSEILMLGIITRIYKTLHEESNDPALSEIDIFDMVAHINLHMTNIDTFKQFLFIDYEMEFIKLVAMDYLKRVKLKSEWRTNVNHVQT